MSTYQILVDQSMYQAIDSSSPDERRGCSYHTLKTLSMVIGCIIMVSSFSLVLFKIGPAVQQQNQGVPIWTQTKKFAMILMAAQLIHIPTALVLLIAVYQNARSVIFKWIYYSIFSTVVVTGINICIMTNFQDNVDNTIYFCFHSMSIVTIYCFTEKI